MHLLAFDEVYGDHNQAIVKQKHVTSLYHFGQGLVVQAHGANVSQLGTGGIQHKFLSPFQENLAFGKLAHPNFRPLQVGHDAHFTSSTKRHFTHHAGTVYMVLRFAMAEVQPHHVNPSTNHLLQQCGIAGRGAKGGNDFGGATGHGGISCS